MRLVIYHEKGGAGKTTLAVTRAVMLDLPLLDLDPQATATRWLELRTTALPAASRDLGWVADCQPGINPSAIPVLAAAEIVAVPVSASFNDLVSLADTIRFIRAHSMAKIAFVCSDLDMRTGGRAALLESLAAYKLPVLGQMTHRVSYRRAALSGKIAAEIDPAAKLEAENIIANLEDL